MRIAVDVMGGDYAPVELIAGAVKWIEKNDTKLILVGRQEVIEEELKQYTFQAERLEIVNAREVVGMDESPTTAMRKKKDSSIAVANRLVQEKRADALVSCGSTGAQMTAAIFVLGRLEGIERPPIVAEIPNISGKSSFLIDVGANVDCRPRQLLQFAVLASAYASISQGLENPRVALLNNGEEESKGNKLSLDTYALLRETSKLNFIGNIEGRDLFTDKSDIIVCDGFMGNIILKSMEGMAMFMAGAIARELGRLPDFFNNFDYTRVGGAPLLGVNGVSVVCHGSSKREAVYNGIRIAVDCVRNDIVKMQQRGLEGTREA